MLRRTPGYAQQIVHVAEQPAREAQLAAPERPLSPALAARLAAGGITELYSHQTLALDAARRGEDVCVTTTTASGKSLCYVLPILDRLLSDPEARALLLFPTKALLHDQRTALEALIGTLPISVGVYDGDTPTADVGNIRRCRIVLSNPDKVHMGLLPYAIGGWASFIRNLRFLVIDEAHSYSGIFGGHVGLVVRRLFRACARVGNRPQVILSSATIGNPAAHVEALTGIETCTVIGENGAPAGPREILLWQARRSVDQEALALFTALIRAGKQTLLFTANRQSADRLAQQAVEESTDLKGQIASYRAGYLADERRAIETNMRDGILRGLISTNANELGVNIGALDAVVMCGYPGTVASFWQQAGRAGRSRQAALAVLVGGVSPLEAFYFANPAALLGAPVEPAHLPVENPNLLRDQIWCAARDAELKREDGRWFGGTEALRGAAQQLVEDGRLVRRPSDKLGSDGKPLYYYSLPDGDVFPPRMVNLRSIGSVNFVLHDSRGLVIERGMTLTHVLREAYPGAIYHSQFRTYKIEDVDYANLSVSAQELGLDPGYVTQAQMLTLIGERTAKETSKDGPGKCYWGDCSVVERVTGYIEKPKGRGVQREVGLSMLPRTLATQAVWWEVSPAILSRLAELGHDEQASMGGLARLMVALLPIFSQSDARDTAVAISLSDEGKGLQGFLTVYDDVEGGCNLTRRGFDRAAEWLQMAEERLASCRCAGGCPSCIHAGPPASRHGELDKAGARLLARLMLGIAITEVAPKIEAPKPRTIQPAPKAPAPPARTPERRVKYSEIESEPTYKVTRVFTPPAVPAQPSVEPATNLSEVLDRWPLIRSELRARTSGRLFEYILAAEPAGVKGTVLTLDFGQDAGMAQLFYKRENRNVMEKTFSTVLGYPYRLRCIAEGYDSK